MALGRHGFKASSAETWSCRHLILDPGFMLLRRQSVFMCFVLLSIVSKHISIQKTTGEKKKVEWLGSFRFFSLKNTKVPSLEFKKVRKSGRDCLLQQTTFVKISKTLKTQQYFEKLFGALATRLCRANFLWKVRYYGGRTLHYMTENTHNPLRPGSAARRCCHLLVWNNTCKNPLVILL